jgi:hypothetical protein
MDVRIFLRSLILTGLLAAIYALSPHGLVELQSTQLPIANVKFNQANPIGSSETAMAISPDSLSKFLINSAFQPF